MEPVHEDEAGAVRKLTYADYCAIPEDLLRHEILDGEHFVSPSPLVLHQKVSLNLASLLHGFLRETGLGEVLAAPSDVLLGPFTVVQPDLYVVLAGHRERLRENGCHGPPDLVIEILSPSNRAYDQVQKRRVYEASGIPEYWVIDPDAERIEVYRRSAPDEGYARPLVHESPHDLVVETPFLPGLSLALADVFDPGPLAKRDPDDR